MNRIAGINTNQEMITNALKNDMGIHHIVFTILNAIETEKFYTKIFGNPLFANATTSIYKVGQTMLIFKEKETQSLSRFDPSTIGLDHVAFGLKDLTQLEEIEQVLNIENIQHSGIHIDSSSKKEKIWLNDPSNIRVEFYL